MTPWTVAHQAPLSVVLWQEYWSRLPCSHPGNLPDPGMEPMSLTSSAFGGGFSTTSATWSPLSWSGCCSFHREALLEGILQRLDLTLLHDPREGALSYWHHREHLYPEGPALWAALMEYAGVITKVVLGPGEDGNKTRGEWELGKREINSFSEFAAQTAPFITCSVEARNAFNNQEHLIGSQNAQFHF